jgi:hypothetical protein
MSGEAYYAEGEMKCDYCKQPAILKFRLMRLVRCKGRWQRVRSGQWLAGCAEHLSNARSAAEAGIKR